MDFIKQLEWRYATKRMNGEKVSDEKKDTILKAIQLAPSSLGLQPIKVLVIESKEAKEKLATVCQQPQVMESSAVLVFCSWAMLTEQKIDAYMNDIANTRGVDISTLQDFKNRISSFTQNMDVVAFQQWAAKQAYISLGFGLTAAAMQEVDATPMEGFNPTVLDEVFQLQNQELKSVVLLALGYRDEEKDYLAKAKKVRRPSADFFEFM